MWAEGQEMVPDDVARGLVRAVAWFPNKTNHKAVYNWLLEFDKVGREYLGTAWDDSLRLLPSEKGSPR